MIEEEVIIKTSRYANEDYLIVNIVAMISMSAIFFGGDSEFIKIFFALFGVVAPVNLIKYRRSWLDSNKYTIVSYFALLLPFVISLLIGVYGLFNCLIINNSINFNEFITFDWANTSTIVSASDSTLNVIIAQLVSISAFATALSIFFITQSRYIIRRILFLATLVAGSLALLGLGLEVLYENDVFERFSFSAFSVFAYSSEWSAFAILWLGAGLCVANYTLQRYKLMEFIFSRKFYATALSMLLLVSVLTVGSLLEQFFALSISFIGFGFLFLDTVPTAGNLQRHWTSKKISSKNRFVRASIPTVIYLAISLASLLAGFKLLPNIIESPMESSIVVYADTDFVSIDDREVIKNTTIDLIEKRKNFGWGTDSFKTLFAFNQGSDLGDSLFTNTYSDLLQKLLENGLVGLCLVSISPLILFLRWLFKFDFSRSGFILLPTFLSILLLGTVSNPFESLAVLISFWVVMISMFAWDSAKIR